MMNAGLHVELVGAALCDIPTLISFLSELFTLEQDFEPDPARQTAALELIFAHPEQASVFIIKAEGETAGMVVLHLSISTAEGGWCGRIEDVYLKPEFRRRGIGSQVIRELVVTARKRGIKRLTLAADKDNPPALAFYKACGFDMMNLVTFVRKTTNY